MGKIRDFFIDSHPVTNIQYVIFLKNSHYVPVRCVSQIKFKHKK